jgi:hypothetical protein
LRFCSAAIFELPPGISTLKWDEAFVVLMLTLPDQEVVIAAPLLFGERATGFGAMLVNGAVSFGRVEESASAFEDIIFLMSQNAMAVFLDESGEFALGLFITDLEALGQSGYVAFRDLYPIISATVSRAFRTIVTEACADGLAVGPIGPIGPIDVGRVENR